MFWRPPTTIGTANLHGQSFDGSKPGESHVGWGFAAFVCGEGGYQLEHLAYGCILDDHCPVVHGIPVPLNARTGETEALLQATIWSLTHLGYYLVELYYDAISVGHGGTGQWNFPGGDKHSRALRALIQYAEQFHDRGFLGRHVKAHTGVLGNEVANFLAQYGRTSQQVCGISQIDLGTFLTGDRMPLEWLWMQLVPQSPLDESYPAISPGTLTAKGLTIDPEVDKVFPAQLKEKAQSDSKLTYANFFVATYNVGSLQRSRCQDDHTGLCPQEYLRRQAQSHGISCLMLQETRARTSGMILSDTHIRLVAACQNGSGGTEIWLAKRSSTGGALGIKQSDVLVLLSEPELLCVRVQWPYGLFLLISAHGPHSGYPKHDIEQWWQRLSSIVDRFHTDKNAWLVVGIDANTNFEDDFLPHQGGHGLAHHSNPICKHFRTFLQRHDLFLPSTFDAYHQGATDTWRVNAERKGARCDYVCLPLVWTSSKMTSQNLPNLDAGTSTFDHMAVGVWCQLSFHKSRRPKSGFDTNKISSQLVAHGHELIPPLLDIPWTCDVHQHAAKFSDITTDWLRQHCGGIMRLYRRVTMGHLGPITQKWSDEKVQASLELPDPLDLLHVYRLRYVQHLYRAGDAIVWATLQQHPYWWQMLDKSLEWLRRHTLRTLPVESCLERWDLWEPWLQGNGRAWRSIVRQAMVHSALQIRKESLWQDFHRQVCHTVLEAQVYVLPVDVGEWDQHACPRCKMVFKSCAAWSVHAFRKHGRRTPARQFASGRSCDYCLKIFHDHMGLVNHLKNNPSCYWQYSTRGEVVQPEPSLGSAAEIKARAELRCPVTYAVGPHLPQQIVSDPVPTEDQHALLRAWREAIAGFEVETIHTGDVREALRIATLETCLPPFEILYVAKSLRLQMQKDGEIIFGVGIHRGFTRFINEFTVEWLLGERSKPTVELKDPQEVLQRWRQGEQRHRVVPKPLRFKQILVAHLFSGRRRPDDFQEWAAREVWSDQRFGIVPLSVDIIFSEEWGNLSNPRTFSWFVDAVTSHQLVAILAGPPCETWSIARERGLYADDGPKPLRSSSALSGFVGLTNRETRQLCTGNELLGVAITLATHLWLAGGICIIEHPSEPKPEHAPSIWRTESMQFLLAHRENKRTLVHQGYFGAKSAKPTEFMMTNAPPSVSQIFRCNQVRFDLPTYVSIGVDEHGKYATSSLKEYPPALNRALWQVVSTQLRGRGFSEHPEDCPEGVLRNFSKLHALLDYDVKEMGPDYHPTTLN